MEVAVQGSLIPDSPYGLCGRKATLKNRAQDVQGSLIPESPYGLCGRKATLNVNILNIIHRLDFFSLSKLQPWKTPC